MNSLNLLYSKASFDGVHFFNNSISIFGFEVKFYALCIMLGMVACMIVAIPMFKRVNLNPDLITDLMIAIIPICIVTARLWYVVNAIDEFDSFAEVINIRNGGLAIIGGVAGGALAVFIVTRIKKISFLKIADIACVLLPLGQAIGRWGNFFNMEVYGQESQYNFFPFAVYIGNETYGTWHVPLFLCESLLNLVLFTITFIFFMKRKNILDGYTMCFYFLGYGIIRYILEPLRDSTFNLTGTEGSGTLTQQVTAGCIVILGILCLIYFLFRDRKFLFKKIVDRKGYKYLINGIEGSVALATIAGVLIKMKTISLTMHPVYVMLFIILLGSSISLIIYGIVRKRENELYIGVVMAFVSIVYLLFKLPISIVFPIVAAILFTLFAVGYIIFYKLIKEQKSIENRE